MTGIVRPDRGWRYRTGVGVRSVLALVGSYVLGALTATLLARILPTDRISASVWATLAGLLMPVPVALAIFLAASATRAALLTGAGAAALWAGIWLIGPAA